MNEFNQVSHDSYLCKPASQLNLTPLQEVRDNYYPEFGIDEQTRNHVDPKIVYIAIDGLCNPFALSSKFRPNFYFIQKDQDVKNQYRQFTAFQI